MSSPASPRPVETSDPACGYGSAHAAFISVMTALKADAVLRLTDLNRHVGGACHPAIAVIRHWPRGGHWNRRPDISVECDGVARPARRQSGPKLAARAAVDDQRPAPRGQLKRQRRGMGIGRRAPTRWRWLASMITLVRPPTAAQSPSTARRLALVSTPLVASAASSRPSRPRPPP